MTSHIFDHFGSQLSYTQSGKGSRILLLFHGFGQDHSVFAAWNPTLENRFTIYSFDLFYHGRSTRADEPLDRVAWVSMVKTFLDQRNISKVSVGGYSLGGRFVLALMEAIPERIDTVLLTAPDGFYQTAWYRFATHRFTRGLFRYYMQNPNAFKRLVRRMEQLHFVNTSLTKFVKQELAPPENRKRVYRSWVYFKPLLLPRSHINRVFQSFPGQIHVLLGERDRIIQPEHVIKPLLGTQTRIHLLDIRHHELIDPKHIREYLTQL